jgi:translation elongation factor EF-Tu-like GTPase
MSSVIPWDPTPENDNVSVWFKLFEHDVSSYTGKVSLSSGGSKGQARKSIDELMVAIDEYIPAPEREFDKPFLMPVEDVFSIEGRGSVWFQLFEHDVSTYTGKASPSIGGTASSRKLTGGAFVASGLLGFAGGGHDDPEEVLELATKAIRLTDRAISVEDYADLSVFVPSVRTTPVTGVGMFKKTLNDVQAGDNVGVLLRGTARKCVVRCQMLVSPGMQYRYSYRCDLDLLPIELVIPLCCTPNRQTGIKR